MIGGLLIEFRQRSQCTQTWDVYGGCNLDYQIKSYKSHPRKTWEEASWRKLASRVFEPALAQRPQSFCVWSEAVLKVVKAMSSWHNNGWERLVSRVEALLPRSQRGFVRANRNSEAYCPWVCADYVKSTQRKVLVSYSSRLLFLNMTSCPKAGRKLRKNILEKVQHSHLTVLVKQLTSAPKSRNFISPLKCPEQERRWGHLRGRKGGITSLLNIMPERLKEHCLSSLPIQMSSPCCLI